MLLKSGLGKGSSCPKKDYSWLLSGVFLIPPVMRLCHNPYLSLRALRVPQGKLTEVSVAIFLFPMHYEIASVVSLPRNDITTQSLYYWSLIGMKDTNTRSVGT
jgi:hypothetical protein